MASSSLYFGVVAVKVACERENTSSKCHYPWLTSPKMSHKTIFLRFCFGRRPKNQTYEKALNGSRDERWFATMAGKRINAHIAYVYSQRCEILFPKESWKYHAWFYIHFIRFIIWSLRLPPFSARIFCRYMRTKVPLKNMFRLIVCFDSDSSNWSITIFDFEFLYADSLFVPNKSDKCARGKRVCVRRSTRVSAIKWSKNFVRLRSHSTWI